MYIVKQEEAQRRYFDGLARAFPEWFKPESDDYDRKLMITISRADGTVKVEILRFPPRLPVEFKLGGDIFIDGHEVESDEQKILVHSILSDLVPCNNYNFG